MTNFGTTDKKVLDILKDLGTLNILGFIDKYDFVEQKPDHYGNKHKVFNYASIEDPIFIRVHVMSDNKGSIFSDYTIHYDTLRTIKTGIMPYVHDNKAKVIDIYHPERSFTIEYDEDF